MTRAQARRIDVRTPLVALPWSARDPPGSRTIRIRPPSVVGAPQSAIAAVRIEVNSRISVTIGGVALIAAALVFWGAEAIAASAWPTSSYSYIANVISDLGVPTHEIVKGEPIYSPLAWVMNGG